MDCLRFRFRKILVWVGETRQRPHGSQRPQLWKLYTVDPTSPWFTWSCMKSHEWTFAKLGTTAHDNIFEVLIAGSFSSLYSWLPTALFYLHRGTSHIGSCCIWISVKIWLKFVPKVRINNIPSSIGSDNGLAPPRRQAFIWTNYGLVYWRIYASIGSDNGLAPTRRQAFIWTNDGLVYWCIYASLSLNELITKSSLKLLSKNF